MQKDISEQIADVKNNIRYLCNKYKWENYEISHVYKHHKHHQSKTKKQSNEKNHTICEKKHRKTKIHKIQEPKHKNQTHLKIELSHKDEITIPKQKKNRQNEESDINNLENKRIDDSNNNLINVGTNTIIASQLKGEKSELTQNMQLNQVFADENHENHICLYSSDDDSDSSFDFKEFQKFFKVQNDLYHLTKYSKHKKSKKSKIKSIILSSDSESESYYSSSSFTDDRHRIKNDKELKKRREAINDYLSPIETKDQSTNTIQKDYSTTDTQTLQIARVPSNNKKIKFSAQLKANVKRSLHSFLNSSSSSGTKSNSNNYSDSKGSYDYSAQKLNSTKALSGQLASSENESSRESNKEQKNDNKKKRNVSSSTNSSQSLKKNDSNTKKMIKFENPHLIIEEEEEEASDHANLTTKKVLKKCSIRKSHSLFASHLSINSEDENNIRKNDDDKTHAVEEEEEDNLNEEESLNQILQSAKLYLSKQSGSDDSKKGDNVDNLNQDDDIEKLLKQTVQKSQKTKKKSMSLKTGAGEADENTEAYSQIPSEFSDNIGVDSNLGEKQSQNHDQVKSEKISHAKTTSIIIKLENFMEQSDNIPISSRLENEYESPKKNYNNYASSSETPN